MNLSFLPGELHLNKAADGDYVIKIQVEEVFTTRNEKKAITKFNDLREEMEAKPYFWAKPITGLWCKSPV